jgi:hypothetical protein
VEEERFVRLRDDGTNTHAETSANGTSWQPRGSVATASQQGYGSAVARVFLSKGPATYFFDNVLLCR